MSLLVLEPGLQTTVQDLGRRGLRHLGVGLSGAADAVSLRLANALLGNAASAAGLEITLHGPRLRFATDSRVALSGAEISAELLDDRGARGVSMRRPLRVGAGQELRLGTCHHGARAYLAVAGGIVIEPVLGSRGTDLTAHLGGLCGRALRAFDRLPLGPVPSDSSIDTSFFVREEPAQGDGPCVLRIVAGTHGSTHAAALAQLDWKVAPDASRMGVRLCGARLAKTDDDPSFAAGELISEPVAPGTVQLPPSGAPIILGVEAPTTGGYPRIAHIITADLSRVGQLRPGDALRFRLVNLEEARAALIAQEQRLALVELAVRTK